VVLPAFEPAVPLAQQHEFREGEMTLEQVNLVKESFWKILPIAGVAADLFYDRLFEIAPEVRPLFPDDLVAQKKKLMAMLAVAVTNLHQVDKIASAVEDLGRRHVAYGVTAKHFEPVGAALLWTLEEGLGAEFTPPVKAAWTEAYKTLAGVMKKVAATGSDQRSGTGSDRLRATRP
jgi:hemoglobin-like flavoprotein